VSTHEPVLLHETVDAVCTHGAGQYVDATFGRGGHSRALLGRLLAEARLLAIDRDPEAVAAARGLSEEDARVTVRQGRIGQLGDIARGAGFDHAAGVMLDLGVSSPQLDDPSRGFSFRHDGPLDMRMNPDEGITAAQWLNSAPESELEEVFRRLGEERYARRIARSVAARRVLQPLATTVDLVDVVVSAQPRPDPFKHSATRVFQAVRIRINEELADLERGLEQAFDLLVVGGRLAVITFHSLEDRIVKHAFGDWVRGPAIPRRLPVTGIAKPRAQHVIKSLRPGAAEAARNPRSRSALLRVLEKCA